MIRTAMQIERAFKLERNRVVCSEAASVASSSVTEPTWDELDTKQGKLC